MNLFHNRMPLKPLDEITEEFSMAEVSRKCKRHGERRVVWFSRGDGGVGG